MPALWAASFRHWLRHPRPLALALVGMSLGVATIIAVDIATASSRRAFELSMDAVNGAATHEIVGGPQGIDERLYVDLRTHDLVAGEVQPALAPVVEGYVTVGDREMQLVGGDPLARPGLEVRGCGRVGDGERQLVGGDPRGGPELGVGGGVEVGRGGAGSGRGAVRGRG